MRLFRSCLVLGVFFALLVGLMPILTLTQGEDVDISWIDANRTACSVRHDARQGGLRYGKGPWLRHGQNVERHYYFPNAVTLLYARGRRR